MIDLRILELDLDIFDGFLISFIQAEGRRRETPRPASRPPGVESLKFRGWG